MDNVREWLDAELRAELRRRIDARVRALNEGELPRSNGCGTWRGYKEGCRCDECRAYSAAIKRDYSKRHPDYQARSARAYRARKKQRKQASAEPWSTSA